LDTLRADLGLFSFPEKDVHYRFLSQIKPVYYLRTRAYSRTINVSPFVINYSGAVFREYPAPWQVMVKQNTGELVCVAEDDDRFTLGEGTEFSHLTHSASLITALYRVQSKSTDPTPSCPFPIPHTHHERLTLSC
jgi:hypothetical protein